MAVTYKTNWEYILTALKSKIKAEFKCPVFSNFNELNKATHFIKLIPTGSTQGDVTKFSEHRTFDIDIHYYIMNRKDAQFENYVLRQANMLEALIHDNPTLTLSDSTTAYNLRIGDLEFNLEPDDDYENYFVLGWSFSCEHLSNLG